MGPSKTRREMGDEGNFMSKLIPKGDFLALRILERDATGNLRALKVKRVCMHETFCT